MTGPMGLRNPANCKGNINENVNVESRGKRFGPQYEPLIGSTFQILADTHQGNFMGSLWTVSVSCTLRDGKSDIRSGVTMKVRQHTNDRGIVEDSIGRFTILILGEESSLGRSANKWKSLYIECIDNTLDKTFLSESNGTVGTSIDVDTKETGNIILFIERHVFSFECIDH